MELQPLYELGLKFTLVSLERQYVSTKLKRIRRAKVGIHIQIPHEVNEIGLKTMQVRAKISFLWRQDLNQAQHYST